MSGSAFLITKHRSGFHQGAIKPDELTPVTICVGQDTVGDKGVSVTSGHLTWILLTSLYFRKMHRP